MNKLILIFLCSLMGWNAYTSDTLTTIKGNSITLKNKMVYLTNYDHFKYAEDNYIMDSCKVQQNGDFQFEINLENPMLIIVSDSRDLPPSYGALRQAPEFYFYSLCAKFFAYYPTLFIEPGLEYNIAKWNFEDMSHSIVFADHPNNLLRSYYIHHDFMKGLLDDQNMDFLKIEPDSARAIIMNHKDEWLAKFMQHADDMSEEFKNYMTTEIELGAINEYMLWYDNQSFFEQEEDHYNTYFEKYTSENWNPYSLEYFKMTERFLANRLYRFEKERSIYYPVSEKKISFANKHLPSNIKSKYVSNLMQLRGAGSKHSE